MKRNLLGSLMLLILALVGLCSCSDGKIQKDIIGEWRGDAALLNALGTKGKESATFHRFDAKFNEDKTVDFTMNFTVKTRESGMDIVLKTTFHLIGTYSITGGALFLTVDEGKTYAQVEEYLINGMDFMKVTAEDSDSIDCEDLEPARKAALQEMEKTIAASFIEEFGTGKNAFATDLKVRDGVLSMKDPDFGTMTLTRK